MAFTVLYSHIRYFHPSANTIACDWEQFLIHSVINFSTSHSETELLNKLKSTFKTLANLRFIRESYSTNKESILQIENGKKQFWQHLGICLGDEGSCYKSELIPHKSWIKQQPEESTAKEWIRLKILKGWHVLMPLFGDNTATTTGNQRSVNELAFTQPRKSVLLLADTILSWSILYHFYPYPECSEIRNLKTLEKALSMALNQNEQCLAYLTKILNDGHAHVVTAAHLGYRRALVPFSWQVIDNQVVITKNSHTFYCGDIVKSINGVCINALMTEYLSRFSGKAEFCQYLAFREVLSTHMESGNVFQIQRNREIYDIYTDSIQVKTEQQVCFQLLEGNIAYFDLTKNSVEELLPRLAEVNRYKGVIFDLRGYPIDADILLQHLLTSLDLHDKWMEVPVSTNPNHHMLKFEFYGWGLEPVQPHINTTVCFLTNIKAVSYSESILAIVKYYNLGTIIGEKTAGANGDVQQISLLSGGVMYFTGMRVSLLDGSQLHGVGISPDIEIKQTYEQLIRGRYDSYIETGINYIKGQSNYHRNQ
ncbi:S41 family peptidase [Thalassotalea hakodatensis]|uniref:S41 family peptidase n=1 Tax=Thalassotalea hakodatensis TaxID=3030492 RepID=UPI0025732031|nr:S41 family peptidase [Thalassotalea hakodatensis]